MDATQVIEETRQRAESFSPLPEQSRPVLIVIVGLPGSGKSFFCSKLTGRLPYIVLESDVLRKKLNPRPTYSARESAGLFRLIHYLIQELLSKGVSVILDATNLRESERRPLYRLAEAANARLILVRTEAPEELIRKRLKARAGNSVSDADWAVYQRMKAADEKIARPHYTVDTAGDMGAVIEKIAREARGE